MAVETWVPQEAPLRQLIECLDNSLSARDRTAQKNAELMLKQAKTSLEIEKYLCFLLAGGISAQDAGIKPESMHTARSAAGIMLKNDVKTHYTSIAPASQEYIRSNILKGLRDPNAQIRNFAGNVITELVKQAGIMGWPDALSSLTDIAANQTGNEPPEALEGAANALRKVCEDNRKALNKDYQAQRPLDFLVPRLIDLTSSPNPKVRAEAIQSLCFFIDDKAEAILSNIAPLMQRIFALATDSSDEVKRRICTAVNAVAKVAPAQIAPHMEDLVKYMLAQQTNSDDPELALEAAEFWLTVADSPPLRGNIAPYLPTIVPVLLQCMIYSEDDVIRLEADAEDANVEDRPEDIKPQFASAKSIRSGAGTSAPSTGTNGSITQSKNNNNNNNNDDDLSDGELEEDDDDDDDESPEDIWNLRKCSAAALDVFATTFQKPVFDATLPYLKANLTHEEWPNREAAVLAVGAIADGCMNVIQPALPDLVPFLVKLLDDTEPVVRKITCWSLGRYSGWAAKLDDAGKDSFYLPMMDGILKHMLDTDKRVQEAAASAMATLEEKSEGQLSNPKYCQVIARQFAACFEKYKDRNMFILYDCVQTLTEHVGDTIQTPELINTLMPALLKRWEKLQDQSQEMFPLLECLSYIATSMGQAFTPFATPIFERCIKIIYQTLQDQQSVVENGVLDLPSKDFLVTSLDLLGAVIQSVDEEEARTLVASAQPSMFDLLSLCMQDPDYAVRQSSYALLGDSAIYVFPELRPSLLRIIPLVLEEMDISKASEDSEEYDYPVQNNACWSCGEISLRAGQEMAPYVERILSHLYNILCNNELPHSLHENAAIALGRLGLACPDEMGPHLPTIAPVFMRAIGSIAWTDEKSQAMRGIAKVVLTNPSGLQQCLVQFVMEISSAPVWKNEEETQVAFQKVLDVFKSHASEFAKLIQILPADHQQSLQNNYNLNV